MWSVVVLQSLTLQLGCIMCSITGIINALQVMLEESVIKQECF